MDYSMEMQRCKGRKRKPDECVVAILNRHLFLLTLLWPSTCMEGRLNCTDLPCQGTC